MNEYVGPQREKIVKNISEEGYRDNTDVAMNNSKFAEDSSKCKDNASEKSTILSKKEDIRTNYHTGSSTLANEHSNVLPNGELEMLGNGHPKMVETKQNKDKEKTLNNRDVCFALFWCLFAIVVNSFSYTSAQYLSGAVPVNELNTWKFLVSAAMSAPFVIKSNDNMLIPKSKWHLFLAICVHLVAYNSTLFTACIYLPVGTVSGMFTATSIIVMAFITMCSDRTFQPKMYVGATVSFLGTIFLIQPEFLMFPVVEVKNISWESPCLPFSNTNQTEGPVVAQSDSVVGYTLAVTSGVIMAIYIKLQKCYVADANPFALTMWRSMAGSSISAILMLVLEEPVIPLDLLCVLSLLGHCISISVFAIVMPYAMKTLSAPLINLLQSLNLVSLVVMQYTLMRNILPAKENWMEVLGAVLCFCGSIGGTVYEIIKQTYAGEDVREQITN